MDFVEYQSKAYTAIQEHTNRKEEEMHWALGLGEEAGEVLGVIKHRHYGSEFSVANLLEELGDVMWHVAALCTVFGIQMEDVAKYNILKLANRYPTGSFDIERSNRRHTIGDQLHGWPEAKALITKADSEYIAKQKEEAE